MGSLGGRIDRHPPCNQLHTPEWSFMRAHIVHARRAWPGARLHQDPQGWGPDPGVSRAGNGDRGGHRRESAGLRAACKQGLARLTLVEPSSVSPLLSVQLEGGGADGEEEEDMDLLDLKFDALQRKLLSKK